MSNVVDLLARIGQSSRLQALNGEQLAQELSRELSGAGVDPAVQAAILEQRARQLEQLLGARSNVCCLVHAPQDDEPDDDEQQPEKDSDPSLSDRRVARAG